MAYNDENLSNIGCKSGKIVVIDPNNFDNQGFNSTQSVPLEDLSISVQLETTKRDRKSVV